MTKLKSGYIALCVSNTGSNKQLTIGKTYKLLRGPYVEMGKEWVDIKDDNGNEGGYRAYRFTPC